MQHSFVTGQWRAPCRALYNHVKEAAKVEQAAGVRLYADMHNARANSTVCIFLHHTRGIRTVGHVSATHLGGCAPLLLHVCIRGCSSAVAITSCSKYILQSRTAVLPCCNKHNTRGT